jgi:hypothetical protein
MKNAVLVIRNTLPIHRAAILLLYAVAVVLLILTVIELLDLLAGLLGMDALRDVNAAVPGAGAAAGGAGAGAAAAGSSSGGGSSSSGGGNQTSSPGSQSASSSGDSGTTPSGSAEPVNPYAMQNLDPSARAAAEYEAEQRRVQAYNAAHPDQTTAAPPPPSAADQAKQTAIESFWTLGGLSPR